MEFYDLMGIDSSALGDGKSQGLLEGDMGPLAARKGAAFSGRTHHKRRLDGAKYVALRSFGLANQVSIPTSHGRGPPSSHLR